MDRWATLVIVASAILGGPLRAVLINYCLMTHRISLSLLYIYRCRAQQVPKLTCRYNRSTSKWLKFGIFFLTLDELLHY
eukprot:SAG11_NODE_8870_length_968_cov_0.990794_1_plen_78_part_10